MRDFRLLRAQAKNRARPPQKGRPDDRRAHSPRPAPAARGVRAQFAQIPPIRPRAELAGERAQGAN
jgi:hypothetical protein